MIDLISSNSFYNKEIMPFDERILFITSSAVETIHYYLILSNKLLFSSNSLILQVSSFWLF